MHIHTCIHRGKINRYTIYISDGHICNTIFIIAQKSNALKCLNIRAPSAILSFFVMFLTFFMSSSVKSTVQHYQFSCNRPTLLVFGITPTLRCKFIFKAICAGVFPYLALSYWIRSSFKTFAYP